MAIHSGVSPEAANCWQRVIRLARQQVGAKTCMQQSEINGRGLMRFPCLEGCHNCRTPAYGVAFAPPVASTEGTQRRKPHWALRRNQLEAMGLVVFLIVTCAVSLHVIMIGEVSSKNVDPTCQCSSHSRAPAFPRREAIRSSSAGPSSSRT
jgi:hypothetical protein